MRKIENADSTRENTQESRTTSRNAARSFSSRATDTEAAAREAEAFLAAKRRADDAADLLRQVLKETGIAVGDRTGWPHLEGQASPCNEPSVYLGSVPLATVNQLTDTLISAQLQERKRRQRALGYDTD